MQPVDSKYEMFDDFDRVLATAVSETGERSDVSVTTEQSDDEDTDAKTPSSFGTG